jgi:flavodoxin
MFKDQGDTRKMKTIVIYDSNYGNTQKVAEEVAAELQGNAISVKEIKPDALIGIELLVVGSPINAWRATPGIRNFLGSLGNHKLAGIQAAAFDTRVKSFLSGDAAIKISRALEAAGASIVISPQAFYVKGNEGPLAEGELEHSKKWAGEIRQKLNTADGRPVVPIRKPMKALRIALGVVLAVIALNAFGGGYYGMAGAKDVPPEWLYGSPFKSYFLPALFLFVVIGGACLAGSIAAFRNANSARGISLLCAGLLISWIIIQVAIIGYVSWMQPAIFISALCISCLAWFLPKQRATTTT